MNKETKEKTYTQFIDRDKVLISKNIPWKNTITEIKIEENNNKAYILRIHFKKGETKNYYIKEM